VDDERAVHSCAAELMITARGSLCGDGGCDLRPVPKGGLRDSGLRPLLAVHEVAGRVCADRMGASGRHLEDYRFLHMRT
jgi:hypothetical protein